MTTQPAEQWVCGARETTPAGHFECVRPPGHVEAHYYVRLVQRVEEAM
jgi:hypothetical protein